MRTKQMAPTDEPKKVDLMDEHEVKGHLSTLMDAHSIMSDPEKMAKVHALAGRHEKALSGIKSVKQLKDVYQEKFGKKAFGKLGKSAMKDTDKDGM